ncbi:hypothetical protein [Kitasatospora sp. NPDC088346]|uniref:hypothetical protein n=1 Tax=Kitasatospora sp. NPDC088346 TaxID=3364073 RepID=UPI0037F368C5
MSAPDIRVQPEVLQRYAAVIEQQRDQLARIQAALGAVQIPGGAFGHLPDSDELHEGYNDHAVSEQQNLSDLMDVLDHAAEGLEVTADNYRGADEDIRTMMGTGDGR